MGRPAPIRSGSRPVLVIASNGASIVAHALAFGGLCALALASVPTGFLLLATSALVGGSAVLMVQDAEHEQRLSNETESLHAGDHEPNVDRVARGREVRS